MDKFEFELEQPMFLKTYNIQPLLKLDSVHLQLACNGRRTDVKLDNILRNNLYLTNRRFRFCGELDCPDWVLAEISILSKITSVKMKLLCIQVIKDILDQGIDYDKVSKLTADAKFEIGDVKASIAALSFILSSAAKYNVDGDSLSNELQQLGLPKEHSTALCKSYSDSLEKLQEQFRKQSFRLPYLEDSQWRVDYIISSSELKDINEPNVQLKLHIKDPDKDGVEQASFTVGSDKFRVLLHELKKAESLMDSFAS